MTVAQKKAAMKTRLSQGLANLQSIATVGGYRASGTGTPFWTWKIEDKQEIPVIIKESAKGNIYLYVDMSEVEDKDGNPAKDFVPNLGGKFDDVQTLSDYVDETTKTGPQIFADVVVRKPNPAITDEDLKRMEELNPGSTANYRRAVAEQEVSYLVVDIDDEHLD